MKKNALFAGLFCAAMASSFGAHFREVEAAQKDLGVKVAVQAQVEIPVMFTMDTLAKHSDELHSALDQKVKKYTEGTMISGSHTGLAEVKLGDRSVFVSPASITYDQDEIKALKKEKKAAEEKAKIEAEKKKAEEAKKKAEEEAKKKAEKEAAEQAKTKTSSNWGGARLSASAGVNMGPSGKETYYNLPMQGVVNIMRGMGNNDPYWVRDDGVKMLGDYVMIAAHLGIRPRGSLVPTSLGMGIVCDTGGFASGNPTQIDIATAW